MAAIPTLQQLNTAILADLQAQYGISISLIGKVFLRALAMVQAGKLKLFYLTIAVLQKNVFVDTADPESKGGTLERFGRVKLGRDPFQAVAGQYDVTVTGSIGAVIKAQTTFKSDDTAANPGYLYVLDNAYTMVTTSDTITLRALTTGLDSLLNIGDTLTATAPISLVDASATVTAISVQALAAEGIEDYRLKVMNSYRLEPKGGAATDYRLWAQDAQGVKAVYPYAKSGFQGQIDLYVEATVADSTDGQGTPGPTILNDVETVVNQDPNVTLPTNERGRRPLQVIVNYLPISVKQVDINIPGSSFTAPQQTQIQTAIEDFLSSTRPFIDSADVLPMRNYIDINTIIGIIVQQFPGSVFTTPTLTVAGSPVSTYTFSLGNIPHLNSVTFI